MNFKDPTPIQLNRLCLYLRSIFVGQLFVVESLQYPAFFYNKKRYFQKVLHAGEGITSDFIRDYAQKYSSEIFIHDKDLEYINSQLKETLTKLTRSLSIGDVGKNSIKQSNFLSMQMGTLYKNPFDDTLLSNQFQNSKNLGSLLINNKDIQKDLFHTMGKSNYHYTLMQPLLSSIILLGFMQSIKLFSEKEIENFFLTSYFKDIGMSFIPREKFELSNLTEFDKDLFAKHSENSMLILEGRVPLNHLHLNLIKNHHYLNYKIQALVSNKPIPQDEEFITGIESNLLSGLDILVAMITPRPYRKSISSYKALELLKKVMSDEYPQEFKALVVFLKNFLSK